MPERILTQLHRIAQVMDFDAIYIADEVKKGAIYAVGAADRGSTQTTS